MFSRNRKTAGQRDRPAAPTLISTDLRIDGDVTSDGEIQVDGVVNGDVKCDKLCVGPTGRIKGAVTAERMLVRGHVAGQIKARVVTLTRTARVTGDVLHETLTVEAGARLEGHCRRMDAAPQGESNINLVVSDASPTTSSSA
jgi:cytoskeletal protein CcmA (bactofilin family)